MADNNPPPVSGEPVVTLHRLRLCAVFLPTCCCNSVAWFVRGFSHDVAGESKESNQRIGRFGLGHVLLSLSFTAVVAGSLLCVVLRAFQCRLT
jgi:hypothetical protein